MSTGRPESPSTAEDSTFGSLDLRRLDLRGGPALVTPALSARLCTAALLQPLSHRIRRGEGLLLLVNLSISLSLGRSHAEFALQACVSALTLGLLYLLNDILDAPGDRNDPSKEQTYVRLYLEHRTAFLYLVGLGTLAAIDFALAGIGPNSAAAVAAISLVNLAYSTYFKGRAVGDVLVVALWGGLYAAVAAAAVPPRLLLIAGVMTGICHVFQISRDRHIDERNQIRTSAVTWSRLPTLELGVLCLTLGALLVPPLGLAGAGSALTPLLLRLALPNQRAWLLSKAYYGVVWLMVLVGHAA